MMMPAKPGIPAASEMETLDDMEDPERTAWAMAGHELPYNLQGSVMQLCRVNRTTDAAWYSIQDLRIRDQARSR
jgi:hypothetical protein